MVSSCSSQTLYWWLFPYGAKMNYVLLIVNTSEKKKEKTMQVYKGLQ